MVKCRFLVIFFLFSLNIYIYWFDIKRMYLFVYYFFVIQYTHISRSPSLCSSLQQRSALLPWQDNLSRAKAITVCKSKQREVQIHSKADKSSIQLFLLCGHCNMKSHNRTYKFVQEWHSLFTQSHYHLALFILLSFYSYVYTLLIGKI